MVYQDPFSKEVKDLTVPTTTPQTSYTPGYVSAPVISSTSPNLPPTSVPAPILDTRTLISSTPKPGYIQGYDTRQGFAPVYVPKGTYVAGISATGKELTPDKLAPTSNYVLPSGEPGTQQQADAAIALAKANTEAAAKAKAEEAKSPPPSEAELKNQSILDKMVELTGEGTQALTERATALQDPELLALKKEQGITEQRLGEVIAESEALDASYQKANQIAEGKPQTLFSIQGEQAQNYKMYLAQKNELATKANVIRATSLGLQGRIAEAKSTIQDAFDAKVAIIDSKLKNWQAQANAIAPTLNKEETARLEELKARKAKEVQDAKDLSTAQTKAISDLYDAGVAVDSNTALEIKNAKTAGEVQNVLTKFAPQLAKAGQTEQKIKDAQLAKLNADIRKTNSDIANQGVAPITNPTANKYSGALSVILGSERFTKDQKAAVVNAINSGDDPFVVIKNQAKNIAGQTEATKITNYEVARDQLEDISTLLDKYYQLGGKTNIFKGNYEKALNNLGSVDDPKLVSVATQISSALQIYRNAISGTAYSVQEGKDIASIFPGINKSQGLNEAILEGRKAAFNSTIDGSYRSVLGKSYDELKKDELNANKPVIDTSKDPLGIMGSDPLGIL